MQSKKVEVLWDKTKYTGLDNKEEKVAKVLRVAAYCRVSTDLEEQNESFEMQEKYYTRFILNNPGWRLAGIYADRGISGTQKSQRIGFQRMMRHCEEGKIDRIICKSISRFARNTMDSLDSIRSLRAWGISVYFEKEGIDTLSVQSEFLLSTIAAIAQEESRAISENMGWAFKKRFEKGVPVFKKILGYDVSGKGANRKIKINKKEAKVVKEVFNEALTGKGYTEIARIMMAKGYAQLNGKTEWTIDTVKGILTNERYKGDVLCQKTYTADYLTHKTVRNNGEKKQYYIENHHPAIIDSDLFDEVQSILARGKAKSKAGREKTVYPLSGRLRCGDCGANYHRYNTYSYGRWACSRRNKGRNLCSAKSIAEADIEKAMRRALEAKYDFTDEFVIHKMKLDIKRIQEDDNVERIRVILKREIRELVSQSLRAKGDELQILELKAAETEEKLKELEVYWVLLEKDREKRALALEWLDTLPRHEHRLATFFKELNIEYLRAWVIDVTILSPISFTIKWYDNTLSNVSLENEEGGFNGA